MAQTTGFEGNKIWQLWNLGDLVCIMFTRPCFFSCIFLSSVVFFILSTFPAKRLCLCCVQVCRCSRSLSPALDSLSYTRYQVRYTPCSLFRPLRGVVHTQEFTECNAYYYCGAGLPNHPYGARLKTTSRLCPFALSRP